MMEIEIKRIEEIIWKSIEKIVQWKPNQKIDFLTTQLSKRNQASKRVIAFTFIPQHSR